MSATEARGFSIPDGKAGFYYRVDRGTVNMQSATKWSKWFKFESIDFNNATAEYPSDNVGVNTAWTPPDAFERMDPKEQVAVITAISEGKGELRLDGRAKNWAGKAVAEALELDPTDDGTKKEAKAILDAGIDRGYLAVREGKDSKRMVREFVVPTEKGLLLRPDIN